MSNFGFWRLSHNLCLTMKLKVSAKSPTSPSVSSPATMSSSDGGERERESLKVRAKRAEKNEN